MKRVFATTKKREKGLLSKRIFPGTGPRKCQGAKNSRGGLVFASPEKSPQPARCRSSVGAEQGCGKWNPRICDTTKRASQRLTPPKRKGEIPLYHRSGEKALDPHNPVLTPNEETVDGLHNPEMARHNTMGNQHFLVTGESWFRISTIHSMRNPENRTTK